LKEHLDEFLCLGVMFPILAEFFKLVLKKF